MWLYMSRDFEDFFVARDVSRLRYAETPADPEDQSLRLLNNPAAKYLIGLSRRAVGYDASQENWYWEWSADWDWNVENGRLPGAALLTAARNILRVPCLYLTMANKQSLSVLLRGRLISALPRDNL